MEATSRTRRRAPKQAPLALPEELPPWQQHTRWDLHARIPWGARENRKLIELVDEADVRDAFRAKAEARASAAETKAQKAEEQQAALKTALQHITKVLGNLVTSVRAREDAEKRRFEAMLESIASLCAPESAAVGENQVELTQEFLEQLARVGDE